MAAAQEMLDEEHAGLEHNLLLSDNDKNLYTLGSVGGHNVAIVCLPAGRIGNNPAAVVATRMQATFKNIQLRLMVGIGGGVPSSEADVRLGDVVVSQPHGNLAGVVQYDMGKTTPGGFERTGSMDAPPEVLLAALARVKANNLRGKSKLSEHISKLEGMTKFQRSNAGVDVLFEATYDHVAGQTCDRCSPDRQEARQARPVGEEVVVHYGTIASGNQVIRSAAERDRVSAGLGTVLCFEMEAAGLMNSFPCLVIRGICDYADSHKNKLWQPYAAGTAAAYAKEVLLAVPPAELSKSNMVETVVRETNGNSPKPNYHLPFLVNRHFVGRKNELYRLQKRLMVDQDCQELSIAGLGGSGKTQLALQFAYSVKDKWPEYSIFWVPVLSRETFEQACVSIAKILGIPQVADDKEDIKELVKQRLSSSRAGRWLMVVDNADDPSILFETAESQGIVEYLPKSEKGIILYTTRTMEVAVSLTQYDVLKLEAMDRPDAIDFFSESLIRKELLREHTARDELLEELTRLPLAIAQAAAYLNMNRMTIAKYLRLLRNTEQDLIGLLSREFRDNTRYKGSANAVATTWVVSFSQLRERDAFAADLLEFISCIEWKAVPRSLLPKKDSEEEMESAIGTLCGYSFLVRRDSDNQGIQEEGEEHTETEGDDYYDIHRLVHLATRIWVKKNGDANKVAEDAIRHVAHVFPDAEYENRVDWRAYLPHALQLVNGTQHGNIKEISELWLRMGMCVKEDGRYREALTWLEKSCQQRDHLSEDDPDRLISQYHLATVYAHYGQAQKSILLLEHIVKIREKTPSSETPSLLESQESLAIAYIIDGQAHTAVTLLEGVIEVLEKTRAPENDELLSLQRALSTAYLNDDQIHKALLLAKRIMRDRDRMLPLEHPERIRAQHYLGMLYLLDGHTQRAMFLLKDAVNMSDKVLELEHPDRIECHHMLAMAYYRLGQVHRAVALLKNIINIEARTLPDDHPLQQKSLELLADMLEELDANKDEASDPSDEGDSEDTSSRQSD
ncbi:kinesin light chain [Bipolaris maydis]|nr:kinesin light chain [Bipolaris maydis]